MKRGWKIFWITCAVIAVIGFGCCMTALALGVTTDTIASRFPYGLGIIKGNAWHHSEESHSGHSYTGDVDDSETFSDVQINEIDAHISAGELHVLKSDTDEFKIETYEIDSRLKLNYYVEDGELKIETKKHIWGLTGGNHPGTIYLFVPEGYELDEASFEVGAGTLYIEDIRAVSLDIEVGAGEATIDRFSSGEAGMECGAGKITASGHADWEMDVNCDIGEIDLNLEAEMEDYSYNIKCGVGEVNVGDEHYSGIGGKKKIEHHAGKEMDIDCGVGTINVDFY